MKTETTPHTDDLQLLRSSRAAQPVSETRVEEVMARDFVSLPPWFSAAQAAKVLRQTGKSCALFNGRLLATVTELEAGGAKSAASCATPLGPAISVAASLDDAWAIMQRKRLERAAVVLGGVLVGIVTREALADRLSVRRAFPLAA